MNQEGGKLIGQGVYGCVFDPPLVCKGQGRGRVQGVGKITGRAEADGEFFFAKRLAQIQGAQDYFLLADSLCVPAPRSEQTEKDITECEVVEKKQLPDFLQLTMPLGGKPLSSYPKRVSTLNLEAVTKHLLEAGTLLIEAGLVHFDLHAGNILVDSPRAVRIIDFGMMWEHAGLSLENTPALYHQFNPRIRQEPPEICVMNGLIAKMSLDDAVEATIDGKPEFDAYARMFQIPRESVIRTFRRFLNTSWSFEKHHWYSFYKLYWNKIDAWSIGVLLMRVYLELIYDNTFKRLPNVESVIRNLCLMDAGKRYDCVEALAAFDPSNALLERPVVARWLTKQQQQREQIERVLQLA